MSERQISGREPQGGSTEREPGVRVENLTRRFDDFTISANFEVANGERAALIGRSGSGKTTLLRMIAGLERADSGRIWLAGQEISSLSPQDRQIGLVFQDFALFPSMSVLDNVTFGLRMRGVAREQREAEGLEWLDRVSLRKFAGVLPGQLSGGEKQRVAFVRALIWKPRLILLDEPFSALDRELRSSLCDELIELHQLLPVPMILVSHDEMDLSRVATSRLILGSEPGSPLVQVTKPL